MNIEGATAVVTGASSGLGRGIAMRLAAKGARLGLMGRDVARLEAVAAECRDALSAAGDITDQSYVARALERFERELGPVGILLNCAGVSLPARLRLEEIDPAMFQEMIDTNVRGTYLTCHHVLPGMKARGAGTIVNIGSTGAHVAQAGVSSYAASKFAVRALTDSMVQECDGTGVRICMVSSGPIDTPIWDKRHEPATAERRATMLKTDDIADAALWLIERPDHVRVDEILLRPARRTPMEMPA
jgi:NADP-dependent 3-hydroxy acid dehydrogenase YdfG